MNKSNTKKRFIEGVVVSDKMKKTIVVKINKTIPHSVYKKPMKKIIKLKVHDPDEVAKIGDRVKIVEARPFSKDKHFLLREVIK